MGFPALPLYPIKILAADGAVASTPGSIMAVLVMSEHADWKLEFTNDATGDGTNVIELSGQEEGGQTFFDFTDLGGVYFSSKCYLDLTVTSGQVFIWWSGTVA